MLKIAKHLIRRARPELLIKQFLEDLKCYFPNSNCYAEGTILVLCIDIPQIKLFHSGFWISSFQSNGGAIKGNFLFFLVLEVLVEELLI